MWGFMPLLLLVAGPVRAQVAQVDVSCLARETCLPLMECPYWLDRNREKDSLPRGNRQREEIVTQLKNKVCNRRERALCCPPCADGSPCLPSASCPSVMRKLAKRKELKRSRPAEAARILEELQSLVCDKREKLICCAQETRPSTTTFRPNIPSWLLNEEEKEYEDEYQDNYEEGKTGEFQLPRLGQCGTNKGNGRQVIGGKDSEVGEFPWAALLGNMRTKTARINGRKYTTNETRWSCGGVVITKRFVLTAAHCQGRRDASRLAVVRLGEWSVQGYGKEDRTRAQLPPEQDFYIGREDVVTHEGYAAVKEGKFKNVVNDIAIVRLPRDAELNPGVQMICLPHIQSEYRSSLGVSNIISDLEGRTPTVVGWGFTTGFDPWSGDPQGDIEEYGVGSRIQQKLQLPLLNSSTCSDLFRGFQHRNSQLCAGGEVGRDSCKGDSGGGLYIQKEGGQPWYLIGLVSFGSKNCGDGRPGIYTRVSTFIPWIEDTMSRL